MTTLIYNTIKRQKSELLQNIEKKQTPREQLPALKNHLPSPLIKVIYGPRRCGKSTLARLAIKDLKFAYVNFEDEALPTSLSGELILDALERVYDKPDIYFFDEIQNLPRWEQFLHRLQREGKNCLITGSNAHLLSSELATALTGRHVAIELLPFSYREFLIAGAEDTSESFLHYLRHGGFPEVVLGHAVADSYLAALWDSIVLKDIVRRYKIRTIQELNDLYNLVVHAFTSRFSNESLVRSLDQALSAPTVKKFLRYGHEAYLFAELECFHFGVRKRMKFDRKAYTFDNGFVSAKRVSNSSDYGRLLENLVFTELIRRGYRLNMDLFYYTTETKYEVDFLLRKQSKNEELIQVCWLLQEQKTRQRELRSLLQAASALNAKRLRILTLDQSEIIKEGGIDIEVQPVREWLLGER